jgi:hypothetical protein
VEFNKIASVDPASSGHLLEHDNKSSSSVQGGEILGLLASNTFSFIFLPGNFGFILHTIITFSV